MPDERPLQPQNASHGGTSLTPRVPAAPCTGCSGVADLVFVRLIIISSSNVIDINVNDSLAAERLMTTAARRPQDVMLLA